MGLSIEQQAVAFLAAVFGFGLVSRVLTSRWLTPPLVFTVLGLLTGSAGLGWLAVDPETEVIRVLAETTLVLVLFADASRIDLTALRREAGLPVRLLGLGLPLTVVAGAGVAWALFPEWSGWEAALVASILAPTDAALGQAVVSSPAVPQRVRQALNVESGLNDGIALPVVLVFLAMALASERSGASWFGFWCLQVTLGPLVGAAVGGIGGLALKRAARARWTDADFATLASLALAGLCWLGAEQVGGNGFIAAFVGGMAFGRTSGDVASSVHAFLEAEGQLLMLAVFLLLGTALAGPSLQGVGWRAFVYAGLSLTAIRMVPVALALVGSGVNWRTTLFLAWFGPRGLASLLYGLLLIDEGPTVDDQESMFHVVVLTVLGSVVLHGVTARWGAQAYGRWATRYEGAEHGPSHPHPVRGGSIEGDG